MFVMFHGSWLFSKLSVNVRRRICSCASKHLLAFNMLSRIKWVVKGGLRCILSSREWVLAWEKDEMERNGRPKGWRPDAKAHRSICAQWWLQLLAKTLCFCLCDFFFWTHHKTAETIARCHPIAVTPHYPIEGHTLLHVALLLTTDQRSYSCTPRWFIDG
jgi:hypothetical protein